MQTLSFETVFPTVSTVGKWLGRLTALLLLLFWSAFFVEHVSEWFFHPSGRLPPPLVWFSQVFHFAMVVGLALMLKWEKIGAVVTAAGTAGFFLSVSDLDVLPIVLINLVPVACFGVSWLKQRRSANEG